jgi:hypothetical protein
MNNRVFFCFLLISLFICSSSAADRVQHNERYFLEMNGEKLADGSQVYIRYDISISDGQKKANIKITTWHAPISCDGSYDVEKNNGEYLLKYLGGADGCAYPPPQFHLLKKGSNMYIKGMPIVYGQGQWLKLSRLKK